MKSRRTTLIAIMILVTCFATWTLADSYEKPHTFEAGQPILSAQVNANFDELFRAVNANMEQIEESMRSQLASQDELRASLAAAEERLGRLEAMMTISGEEDLEIGAVGVFCGSAAAPDGGRIVQGALEGHRAAKAKCEAVDGCGPTAHMCSAHEIGLSYQLGAMPGGSFWYNSMVYWIRADDAYPRTGNGCDGWRNSGNSPPNTGAMVSNGTPSYELCSNNHIRIACCDFPQ